MYIIHSKHKYETVKLQILHFQFYIFYVSNNII